MAPAPSVPFPSVPWRRAPLVLALLAAAVAALTWPWLSTASSCVLNHWDPPFHAWKLTLAARQILAGHLLPPDGNTNLYYPYSGAFFYEALHWPQAVFAAPLLAAGMGPVAVYHATLVFFWALSGLFFWAFLRALGLDGISSFLGALAFTVLPYRTSYAVEFNMQLSFGLPLLLFAAVRFFQRPGAGYAVLAALAWWLQATSELYQAFFFVLAAPPLVLPLLSRDPALLRSGRRFWLPLALAAAFCAVFALPMLWPYAQTLGDGTLHRSLREMNTHNLQPFSYLLPWGRFSPLPAVNARYDEMSVCVTAALAVAAAVALAAAWRRAASRTRRRALLAAAPALAAAALAGALHNPRAGHWVAAAFSAVLFLSLVWTVPFLVRPGRSVPAAAMAGLAAAALFGFAMSLGPIVSDNVSGQIYHNVAFRLVHRLVPALGGFRVVSRFAVFPVMALCAAAAFGAAAVRRSLRGRPRAVGAVLLAAFVALLAADSVPVPRKLAKRPIRDVSGSAAVRALDGRTEPFVLAVVPMGRRELDSEHMLAVERDDRLGVWAWGGTYPPFTRAVCDALQPGVVPGPERGVALLRSLWPEALVLEDRRPFPGIGPHDWKSWLGPLAETVAEDDEFALFRLLPPAGETAEEIRLVRRDLAAANPRLRFTLSAADGPARVWLDLNGLPLGAWDAGPEPREIVFDFPVGGLVRTLPERFRFHAEGDRPFRLGGFRLEPSGATPSGAPDATPSEAPELPWTGFFRSLPEGAAPLSVRYPGGVELVGADVRPAVPAENGFDGLFVRLFFRLGPDVRRVPALVLCPGFAKDGAIAFRYPTPLRAVADAAAWEVGSGRTAAVEVPLPYPGLLRPGERYDLQLVVESPSGRRRTGRTAGGERVRRADLGLGVRAP